MIDFKMDRKDLKLLIQLLDNQIEWMDYIIKNPILNGRSNVEKARQTKKVLVENRKNFWELL